MHFRDFLSSVRIDLDREIDIFFSQWKGEVSIYSSHLVPLVDSFATACKGGKRVRGGLVSLGHSLFSADSSSAILRVGVAYEIFQTAILAHDDIIDKSLLRRGKRTLHIALGGGHYGISQSISLGNIGYFLGFRLLLEIDFPQARKLAASVLFSRMMLETGIGQLLDVELAFGRHQRSMADVMCIYRLKTAYYTVVAPLLVGAILADAPESALVGIREYGEHVGVIYQIQDDINDIFGTAEGMGKAVGNDIKEGKNTILIVKAMERATEDQRKILKQYYGNSQIKIEEIALVKDVFVKTDVLSFARNEAKRHSAEAKAVISQITSEIDKQVMLNEIAEYFVR